ncbi:MAG: hypothetical protein P8J27_09500 [Mariniblastus sp.]|nr:hypothetical protein [Mariniblastus sp.]
MSYNGISSTSTCPYRFLSENRPVFGFFLFVTLLAFLMVRLDMQTVLLYDDS